MKLGAPTADELGYAKSLAVQEIGGANVILLEQDASQGQVSPKSTPACYCSCWYTVVKEFVTVSVSWLPTQAMLLVPAFLNVEAVQQLWPDLRMHLLVHLLWLCTSKFGSCRLPSWHSHSAATMPLAAGVHCGSARQHRQCAG